jgi:xylulose-5-phosphate/fructose-6-phosphate phosphoketolase
MIFEDPFRAMNTNRLSPELLYQMDAYWRAANFLSVGQIYLYVNPLLKRPLALVDVKHMLPGHWGTTPRQNFIYMHLNRVIKKYDRDMIYVSGPGHGGQPLWAIRTSKARTARSIPTSAKTKPDCGSSSSRFRFPEAFPATPLRSAQARSTRAASWAIRSVTRSEPCSTILN